MMFKSLWCVFIISELCRVCSNEVKSGFMDLDFLANKASRIGSEESSVYPLPEQLRIVPTSRFTCDGNISGFYLGVAVQGKPTQLYPRAEVWRRVVDDKKRKRRDDESGYSRRDSVELRPTFHQLQSGGIYLYTLPPGSSLSFRRNDFFAVFQPDPSETNVILHYTDTPQLEQSTSLVRSSYSSFASDNSLSFISNQYLLIKPISDQSSCFQDLFLNKATIKTFFPEIGDVKKPIHELRLFPDMLFNMDGFIDRWTVGGTLKAGEDSTELQIWKPMSDGYVKVAAYKLKEENSVTVSENVHEYFVSPAIPITTNDIVGVFQPSNTSAASVYYQSYNGPSNIVIPVMAGSEIPNRILTANLPINAVNDYPLLSVHVSNMTVTVSTAETIELTTTMAMDTKTRQSIISTITQSSQRHDQSSQRLVTTTTETSHFTSQVSHIQLHVSSADRKSSLNFSTRHMTSSTLFSSVPMQTVNSVISSLTSETFFISITLVGGVIIVITLPLIVVILAACIYNKRRKSRKTELTKQPTTVLNVPPIQQRESMLDNPLYYYPVVPNHTRSNIPTQNKQQQSQQPIEVIYDEIPLRQF